MANRKISQFTPITDITEVSGLAGYDSTTNVQISGNDLIASLQNNGLGGGFQATGTFRNLFENGSPIAGTVDIAHFGYALSQADPSFYLATQDCKLVSIGFKWLGSNPTSGINAADSWEIFAYKLNDINDDPNDSTNYGSGITTGILLEQSDNNGYPGQFNTLTVPIPMSEGEMWAFAGVETGAIGDQSGEAIIWLNFETGFNEPVPVPPLAIVDVTTYNETEAGENDGAVSITIQGGTPDYDVQVQNQQGGGKGPITGTNNQEVFNFGVQAGGTLNNNLVPGTYDILGGDSSIPQLSLGALGQSFTIEPGVDPEPELISFRSSLTSYQSIQEACQIEVDGDFYKETNGPVALTDVIYTATDGQETVREGFYKRAVGYYKVGADGIVTEIGECEALKLTEIPSTREAAPNFETACETPLGLEDILFKSGDPTTINIGDSMYQDPDGLVLVDKGGFYKAQMPQAGNVWYILDKGVVVDVGLCEGPKPGLSQFTSTTKPAPSSIEACEEILGVEDVLFKTGNPDIINPGDEVYSDSAGTSTIPPGFYKGVFNGDAVWYESNPPFVSARGGCDDPKPGLISFASTIEPYEGDPSLACELRIEGVMYKSTIGDVRAGDIIYADPQGTTPAGEGFWKQDTVDDNQVYFVFDGGEVDNTRGC